MSRSYPRSSCLLNSVLRRRCTPLGGSRAFIDPYSFSTQFSVRTCRRLLCRSLKLHDGKEVTAAPPNILTCAFFINKSQNWAEMSQFDRSHWSLLGWTVHSWDSGATPPRTADLSWVDLTAEQQASARALGYTEQLWDEDEGEVWIKNKKQAWLEMDVSHRTQWEALGWTGATWASDNASAPASADASWSSLSPEQRLAAARLGYTQFTWDNDGKTSDSYKANMKNLKKFALIATPFILYAFYDALAGGKAKRDMNSQEDQVEATHIKRFQIDSRPNWKSRCEDIGFHFHSTPGVRWGPDVLGSFGLQDPYWCEDGVYIFSGESAAQIEEATWEIHNMCLQAVERVVHDEHLMDLFEIPPCFHAAVRQSWEARQPDLIGRFDLLFDGKELPKLLEYNADTPTLLLESSLAQKQWKDDRPFLHARDGTNQHMDSFSQFNVIESHLVKSWPQFLQRSSKAAGLDTSHPHVFVASQRVSIEEQCNADYLARTCQQAHFSVSSVELSDLHANDSGQVEHEDPISGNRQIVDVLWKLYPYEWLAVEELGNALERAYSWPGSGPRMVWAEPPWKLILANKSILALLWEMFPEHPNLLPAFYTADQAAEYQAIHQPRGSTPAEEWGWVAKPRFGREGIGVRYSFGVSSLGQFAREVQDSLNSLESIGHYNPGLLWQLEKTGREALGAGVPSTPKHLMDERGAEAQAHGGATNLRSELPFPPLGGPVYQLFQDTDTFSGRRPVIGSWVVFGNAAGMCVREDVQRTTDNDSCFVPHLVDHSATASVQVRHAPGANVQNLTGKYLMTGQLRGGSIYYCKENKTYLLRDPEGHWMFSLHESGGDGHLGTAVSSAKTLVPEAAAASSWSFLDQSVGEFRRGGQENAIVIERPPLQQARAQLHLTAEQAKLRTELYGLSGGTADSGDRRGHHYRGTGGSNSSYWFRQHQQHQQSRQQRPQQNESEQQRQKERHGRKSANRSWAKYGHRQPTGTFGRSMASTGGGGGGGS